MVSGTSHVERRLQAEVQMCLRPPERSPRRQVLFDPGRLLAMMRMLGVFEVGHDADGQPLQVPEALLNEG